MLRISNTKRQSPNSPLFMRMQDHPPHQRTPPKNSNKHLDSATSRDVGDWVANCQTALQVAWKLGRRCVSNRKKKETCVRRHRITIDGIISEGLVETRNLGVDDTLKAGLRGVYDGGTTQAVEVQAATLHAALCSTITKILLRSGGDSVKERSAQRRCHRQFCTDPYSWMGFGRGRSC